MFGQGGYPNARPIPQIYEVLETAISKGYVFKAGHPGGAGRTHRGPGRGLRRPGSSAIRASARAGEDTEFGRDPETLVSNINYGPYYAIKCKPVPYATLAALDVDGEINVLLPDGTKVGRPVRLRQRLGAA